MNDLTKGIIGVSVVVGVGVTAVAVHKRYKATKSREIITVADLAGILGDRVMKPVFNEPIYGEDSFDDDEEEGDEGEDEEEEYYEEEVETEMRRGTDPNSSDALVQYINMQLADFKHNSNEAAVLRMLYKHPFVPETTGDRVKYGVLLDDRIEFFGPDSKWSNTASWADLILYYATRVNYNLEGGVDYWAGYLIDNLDLTPNMNPLALNDTLANLADHTFVNHESGYFGMFGLDDNGVIDLHAQLEYSLEKKYSFEMEYNAFLHMAMN